MDNLVRHAREGVVLTWARPGQVRPVGRVSWCRLVQVMQAGRARLTGRSCAPPAVGCACGLLMLLLTRLGRLCAAPALTSTAARCATTRDAQGGYWHVNERGREYVVDALEARGFRCVCVGGAGGRAVHCAAYLPSAFVRHCCAPRPACHTLSMKTGSGSGRGTDWQMLRPAPRTALPACAGTTARQARGCRAPPGTWPGCATRRSCSGAAS